MNVNEADLKVEIDKLLALNWSLSKQAKHLSQEALWLSKQLEHQSKDALLNLNVAMQTKMNTIAELMKRILNNGEVLEPKLQELRRKAESKAVNKLLLAVNESLSKQIEHNAKTCRNLSVITQNYANTITELSNENAQLQEQLSSFVQPLATTSVFLQ